MGIFNLSKLFLFFSFTTGSDVLELLFRVLSLANEVYLIKGSPKCAEARQTHTQHDTILEAEEFCNCKAGQDFALPSSLITSYHT